jgi:isoleucyl-tRNA synthetase
MLKSWADMGIYKKMLDHTRDQEPFILHDGPPYANGHIHMGHALNKVLKDIIVKFKSMQGRHAPYVPGWDCHGLPIEHQVDKKLGKEKATISIADKRLKCREYAKGFVDIQREEFKRLGVFGDWERPYITMSFDYEGRILEEFYTIFRKGYAYIGKKPVHWCPSCITALAEAEVEYADKTSPSVFVKFKISKDSLSKLGLDGTDASFAIWTTTPWTLPANLALAVHPTVEYSAMDTDKGVLIVASELVSRLLAQEIIDPKSNTPLKTYKGSELLGLEAHHPFIDRMSKVIEGDFVTTEEGTGIVHIAPGHGEDDYRAGLREGLDVYAPVNDYGKFQGSGVEEIENLFVFKANDVIIDMLDKRKALLGRFDYQHSYPHCWRCKKPVIFRATEQWFISMDHEGLREQALKEVDKVQWVPSWGRERIYGMIQNRPDWCISRQRSWGVPIAVLKCEACGQVVKDDAVLDRVVEEFKQHGADIWYTKEAKEFLPPGYTCPDCGKSGFKKESDILDVWFDSGVSHAVTLVPERGLSWPADMYLEGSDQHRGWFQSSLLASVGTRGQAPYRIVLTHGYTVDGKGKKMSKSLGNVIAPQDIIKQTGADILRLWVSAEDYRGDIRISKEIMARLTEAYRKIRNTAKYLLGNLNGYPGGDHSGSLTEIDLWAMSRLQGLVNKVTDAYENFSFHEVYHRLYHFCIVDMSSFYLDILKDRLYTYRNDHPERRAAQWVLHEILLTMTKLMAPVLSFTAEEIWQHIEARDAESVFLSDFPKANEDFICSTDLESRWARLIAIRDEVNRALEIKRREKFIGNALEAAVTVYASDADHALLKEYEAILPTLFIVSQANVADTGEGEFKSEEVAGLSVSVARAEGEKCQRCWNYSTAVGTFSDAPEICDRCHAHLS